MLSPHEAERMDPQQRLLLEEMYKAIEDSGYSEEEMSGMRASDDFLWKTEKACLHGS